MDSDSAVAEESGFYFRRNGYVRRKSVERAAAEGAGRYKKGDEVRLIARSESELGHIRGLLASAGFRPGKPYAQGSSFRQPVYGRRDVARFLDPVQAES